MVLVEGKTFSFFFGIFMFAIVYLMLRRARESGELPWIRRVAALDAVDEAVGRATEMGKPVFSHLGATAKGLRGEYAGDIIAGLSLMEYVAGLCARLGTRFIVAPSYPEALPLVTELVQSAYEAQGKIDDFNEDDIMFFSNQSFAWATGVMGTLMREKPGAHIAIGPFHAPALMVAETSVRSGAINIIGTPRKGQVQWFVACCDYVLIGEECFAAGAYLSKDAEQIGTIAGQDIVKIVTIAITLLGILAITAGSNFIHNILSM